MLALECQQSGFKPLSVLMRFGAKEAFYMKHCAFARNSGRRHISCWYSLRPSAVPPRVVAESGTAASAFPTKMNRLHSSLAGYGMHLSPYGLFIFLDSPKNPPGGCARGKTPWRFRGARQQLGTRRNDHRPMLIKDRLSLIPARQNTNLQEKVAFCLTCLPIVFQSLPLNITSYPLECHIFAKRIPQEAKFLAF